MSIGRILIKNIMDLDETLVMYSCVFCDRVNWVVRLLTGPTRTREGRVMMDISWNPLRYIY